MITAGIIDGDEGAVPFAIAEAVAIELSGRPTVALRQTWIMKGNQDVIRTYKRPNSQSTMPSSTNAGKVTSGYKR